MKCLLVVGIIAIIINFPTTLAGDEDEYSSSSSSSSEKSPHEIPVKLTGMYLKQLNTEYYSKDFTSEVRKVNKSYNALDVNFTVVKNLPLDTKVVAKIYRATSKDDNYELISQYSIGITDTKNKYYKYLPYDLVKKDTKCDRLLEKGKYNFKDYGVFKFYELLSEKELQCPYFKMIFSLECNGDVFISVDQRFESNY